MTTATSLVPYAIGFLLLCITASGKDDAPVDLRRGDAAKITQIAGEVTAAAHSQELSSAAISYGAVRVPDGQTVLLGQALVGRAGSDDHRMAFGNIYGLLSPPFADFNRDMQVTRSDYPDFQRCLGGPDTTARVGCGRADGDGDFRIDLRDLARFMCNVMPPQ